MWLFFHFGFSSIGRFLFYLGRNMSLDCVLWLLYLSCLFLSLFLFVFLFLYPSLCLFLLSPTSIWAITPRLTSKRLTFWLTYVVTDMTWYDMTDPSTDWVALPSNKQGTRVRSLSLHHRHLHPCTRPIRLDPSLLLLCPFVLIFLFYGREQQRQHPDCQPR